MLLAAVAGRMCAAGPADPPRLSRADSFFGIHMDFHANKESPPIGAGFTAADVEQFLTAVHPDFIQVDCKGHPGYSSYPTKVGNPAPKIVQDPLKIWREVTARHGVALYVHYSGDWDYYMCAQHPDWAAEDFAGVKSDRATSVFGPYVDRVLIPQLKELSDVYHVDGAWVDGDCWGAAVDYSPAARAAYKAATGIEVIPEGDHAYVEFNREGFKRYLRHYLDAIHQHNPRFQITSNWAFSSMMPEAVTANVDFLSGDLTSQNSVNSAAFEARCLAVQGKPWDLMSWAFTDDWAKPAILSYKTAIQLQQEAAEVLAMGGGFQLYYPQNRNATINLWNLPVMTNVAAFCRARQEYAHGAQAVPQIGLLQSTYAYELASHTVYGNADNLSVSTQGVLTALLDGQHCVEIVREYTLEKNLERYRLIVIPEWESLEPSFCDRLRAYVAKGGNVLVIGPRAIGNFQKDLGVAFQSIVPNRGLLLADGLRHSGLMSAFQTVILNPGTTGLGLINGAADPNVTANFPAASIARLGQGKIAAIYFNVGPNYEMYRTAALRDFLSDLIQRLVPDPAVEVAGSHLVHVTLNRLKGQTLVNLINAGGKHSDKKIYSYDEVPALEKLTVSIVLPAKPRSIVQQPEGKALPFTYEAGRATVQVPRLEIYSILAIEGGGGTSSSGS